VNGRILDSRLLARNPGRHLLARNPGRHPGEIPANGVLDPGRHPGHTGLLAHSLIETIRHSGGIVARSLRQRNNRHARQTDEQPRIFRAATVQ